MILLCAIVTVSRRKMSFAIKKDPDALQAAAAKRTKAVKGRRAFTKGEQAAADGDWKRAVAYYHVALAKQREHYGEDHVATSDTLNSLGVAMMNLGEPFGALTALEEALRIRQRALGAGAEEAAETTNNMWAVLRSSREDGGYET